MRRWHADAVLVLVTLIWGSTFVIVKNMLDAVGPFVLIASRFWIAGGVLWLISRWRRTPYTPHLLRDGSIVGVFLTIGFVTQTIGLQTTEAGKAAFITGLSVVLVPILTTLVLREPPSRFAVLGVALAAVGMGLLTLDRRLRLTPGDLWVLACAGAFALHILSTGRFAPRHEVLSFTLAQLLTVAVFTSLAALLFERGQLLPPAGAIPAVLYTALLATAVVFGSQTWAQRHTTSTHTALIFSLEPVFAALFAAVFAGELLTPKEWVGGALILVGMLVAEIGDVVWHQRTEPVLDF